ncbi:MAG: DUF4097 family beta strand repeat-containing protein [Actinomycetota bacterium]
MERTFETPGTPTIDVRLPAGRVEVTTRAGNQTIVRLEPLRDNSASRKAVEHARVEIADGDNARVVVDVREHSSFLSFGIGAEVGVYIEAPAGTHLKAGLASADLRIRGAVGDLEVKTASGDVSAEEVRGRANVHAVSGDVRIDDAQAELSVHSASGDVEIGRVVEAATVRTASGDVALGAAESSVTIQSASGDARVEAVSRGRVSLQSASGDLEVAIAPGVAAYIDAKSMSGDVSSDFDVSDPGDGEPSVDLRASSMSGDVRIRRASRPKKNPGSRFSALLA